MKRFEFRLDRVLGIRRFELERARIALAAAEAEATRLAAAMIEAERRFLEGRRLLEEEMAVGSDGRLLALRAQAVRAGRSKWMFARQAVESFEPKRARARELVRRCRARVESLEHLRDRRAELHRKSALAAEQSELEDLALARFVRSSLALALACVALVIAGPAQAESGGAGHGAAAPPAAAHGESASASPAHAAPASSNPAVGATTSGTPTAPVKGGPGGAPAAGDPAAAAAAADDPGDLLARPALSKGVDLILAEVKEREVELSRRELELSEREGAIRELESMVAQRAGELERIRKEVEARIVAWSSQGQDRIDQLSGVYSAMAPAEAAGLLSKLELDLSVAIIRQMKKKVSAGVLAAMKPERALSISRRILKPLDPASDAPPARPY